VGGEKIGLSYLAETGVLWKEKNVHGSRDESLTLSDLKKTEVLKFA
jgi:hypothetical protein